MALELAAQVEPPSLEVVKKPCGFGIWGHGIAVLDSMVSEVL